MRSPENGRFSLKITLMTMLKGALMGALTFKQPVVTENCSEVEVYECAHLKMVVSH